MKFNIAYPTTGAQKTIEVDDERKIRHFLDKRLSAEVDGEALGDQFKGYIFKIAGGFDKQGFSMKQGVLAPGRVRLLLGKNTSCYIPRRKGERKRKSVRGCIVSNEISALNLVIVKKGPEELPGLTDKYIPRRLGPKRASKIRKLFNLSKEDDVRKYVIRRELPPKAAKEAKEGEAPEKKETKGKAERKRTKAPKIQRLVTPLTLQRKRHRLSLKKRASVKAKADAAEYAKLLAQRQKEARQSVISSKRRASQKSESQKKEASKDAKPAAAGAKPAAKAAAKAAAKPAAAPAKAGAKGAAKPAEKKAAAKPAAAAPAAPAKAAAKPAAAKAPAAKAAAKPAAPKPTSAPKAQSPKQPKQAAKAAKK